MSYAPLMFSNPWPRTGLSRALCQTSWIDLHPLLHAGSDPWVVTTPTTAQTPAEPTVQLQLPR